MTVAVYGLLSGNLPRFLLSESFKCLFREEEEGKLFCYEEKFAQIWELVV